MRKRAIQQHVKQADSKPLRLLLALLVALMPLLSSTKSISPTSAPLDTPMVAMQYADASCPTSQTGNDLAQAVTLACPHCTGDAPLSQCQCCGHVAPAGLVGTSLGARAFPSSIGTLIVMRSDALPGSPGERLYRPPIASS